MADITTTIVIPDALVTRVAAATGIDNNQALKSWLTERVTEAVKTYEVQLAIKAAEDDVAAAESAKYAAVEQAEAAAAEIILG